MQARKQQDQAGHAQHDPSTTRRAGTRASGLHGVLVQHPLHHRPAAGPTVRCADELRKIVWEDHLAAISEIRKRHK
ncbi:hypothetical protein ACIQWA_00590 [Kitasatospora sp. NPDC098652]|uniref:hypothetical protein n=1 Tax=Kitasatospora sp. NPDC098652 TaxID=3364095 RepID=UPI00382A9B34